MDFKKLSWFYDDYMERGQCRLVASLESNGIPSDPHCIASLVQNLRMECYNLSYKVLIAHFKLVEHETSFDEYVEHLKEPEIREYLYSVYPQLRAWMDKSLERWLHQSELFLVRFNRDREKIERQIFESAEPIRVQSLRFGLGDTHRGGQSVALVVLEDGRKLLYKPRSLSIDTHFADVIEWLAAHTNLKFMIPKHLNYHSHGWVEFIEDLDCEHQQDVDCYYERLGALLCVLYVMNASDFHYENIIASKGFPVLVDLESILHPRTRILGGETNEDLDRSVLRTGLLPNRMTRDDQSKSDISGITDADGQEGIVERLFLTKSESGGLSFVREKGRLIGAKNVPKLRGHKVALDERCSALVEQGFALAYRHILQRKAEFRNLIHRFASDEIRVIFRNTIVYTHLLDEAKHPALLKSRSLVEAHFRMLEKAIRDFKPAERFIEHELFDLHNLDVPLFITRANSLSVWWSKDGELTEFFDKNGLECALDHLEQLSEQDLNRQLWIIRTVLSLRGITIRQTSDLAKLPGATPNPKLEHRVVSEAKRVAEYIREHIHVDGSFASWMVLRTHSLDNSKLEVVPAFYDLYGGMPGEILFLAQFSKLTGEIQYRSLAEQALNYLLYRLEQSSHAIRPLGLYTGWGSVIYTLTCLGKLEGETQYFAALDRLLDQVDFESLIQADRNYSLLKGAAGFVVACAEYAIASGSRRALQLAEAAAEHLLQERYPDAIGYSWKIYSSQPLSGLAHGASGFALAFARLYQASGKQLYRDASLRALDYERTLYLAEHGNWQDVRDIVRKNAPDKPFCSVAWAHGAGGIGIARLGLLKAGIDTQDIRSDLDMALETTLREGFTGNHTLIYGDLGNLDFVLQYYEYYRLDLPIEIVKRVETILDQIQTKGWQLANKNIQSLGLMSGVTGIGYQCLRLAFPGRVATILGASTDCST